MTDESKPSQSFSGSVLGELAGGYDSAVVTDRGKWFVWGRRADHMSGNFTSEGAKPILMNDTPESPLANKKVVFSCVGLDHFAALTDEGEVYTMGNGKYGTLGHGDDEDCTKPKQVEKLKGTRVISISCGFHHMAAIDEDGALYCWGYAVRGRCGHGSTSDGEVHVPTFVEISERVSSVSCGSAHTLVVTEEGHVYSFGSGKYGCLGHNSEEDCPTPRLIEALANKKVTSVSAGAAFSACVTEDGQLYTFGDGSDGRLGHDSREKDYSVPKPVKSLKKISVTQASCGTAHMIALSETGHIYSWGDGSNGALGHGSLQSYAIPRLVFGVENVVAVSCAEAHSLIVTADGALYTFGSGAAGQLGHGDTESCNYPKVVQSLSDNRAVGRIHPFAMFANDFVPDVPRRLKLMVRSESLMHLKTTSVLEVSKLALPEYLRRIEERSLPTCVVTRDGRFVDCNSLFLTMAGYDKESKRDFMAGHTFLDLSPKKQPNNMSSSDSFLSIWKKSYEGTVRSLAEPDSGQDSSDGEWSYVRESGDLVSSRIVFQAVKVANKKCIELGSVVDSKGQKSQFPLGRGDKKADKSKKKDVKSSPLSGADGRGKKIWRSHSQIVDPKKQKKQTEKTSSLSNLDLATPAKRKDNNKEAELKLAEFEKSLAAMSGRDKEKEKEKEKEKTEEKTVEGDGAADNEDDEDDAKNSDDESDDESTPLPRAKKSSSGTPATVSRQRTSSEIQRDFESLEAMLGGNGGDEVDEETRTTKTDTSASSSSTTMATATATASGENVHESSVGPRVVPSNNINDYFEDLDKRPASYCVVDMEGTFYGLNSMFRKSFPLAAVLGLDTIGLDESEIEYPGGLKKWCNFLSFAKRKQKTDDGSSSDSIKVLESAFNNCHLADNTEVRISPWSCYTKKKKKSREGKEKDGGGSRKKEDDDDDEDDERGSRVRAELKCKGIVLGGHDMMEIHIKVKGVRRRTKTHDTEDENARAVRAKHSGGNKAHQSDNDEDGEHNEEEKAAIEKGKEKLKKEAKAKSSRSSKGKETEKGGGKSTESSPSTTTTTPTPADAKSDKSEGKSEASMEEHEGSASEGDVDDEDKANSSLLDLRAASSTPISSSLSSSPSPRALVEEDEMQPTEVVEISKVGVSHFQKILEHRPNISCIVNLKGKIIEMNEKCLMHVRTALQSAQGIPRDAALKSNLKFSDLAPRIVSVFSPGSVAPEPISAQDLLIKSIKTSHEKQARLILAWTLKRSSGPSTEVKLHLTPIKYLGKKCADLTCYPVPVMVVRETDNLTKHDEKQRQIIAEQDREEAERRKMIEEAKYQEDPSASASSDDDLSLSPPTTELPALNKVPSDGATDGASASASATTATATATATATTASASATATGEEDGLRTPDVQNSEEAEDEASIADEEEDSVLPLSGSREQLGISMMTNNDRGRANSLPSGPLSSGGSVLGFSPARSANRTSSASSDGNTPSLVGGNASLKTSEIVEISKLGAPQYIAMIDRRRVPTLLCTEKGKILTYNPMFCTLFDWSSAKKKETDAKILTKNFSEFSPKFQPYGMQTSQMLGQMVKRTWESGALDVSSWALVKESGESFNSQLRLVAIKFRGKRCIEIVLSKSEDDENGEGKSVPLLSIGSFETTNDSSSSSPASSAAIPTSPMDSWTPSTLTGQLSASDRLDVPSTSNATGGYEESDTSSAVDSQMDGVSQSNSWMEFGTNKNQKPPSRSQTAVAGFGLRKDASEMSDLSLDSARRHLEKKSEEPIRTRKIPVFVSSRGAIVPFEQCVETLRKSIANLGDDSICPSIEKQLNEALALHSRIVISWQQRLDEMQKHLELEQKEGSRQGDSLEIHLARRKSALEAERSKTKMIRLENRALRRIYSDLNHSLLDEVFVEGVLVQQK